MPMSNTRILRTRLSATAHTVVEAIARQQQLTESAWLRRLIETTLQSSGVVLQADLKDEPARHARLMIRLLPDDQMLLHARAKARGMPAATYAAVVLRSHLRSVAPLPKEERTVLSQAVGELGAIGRNLNQIARLANQGGRVRNVSMTVRHICSRV